MVKGSNFKAELLSRGRNDFEAMFRIVFGDTKRVTHYASDGKMFTLYWHGASGSNLLPLPFEMDVDAALELSWNWLETLPYPEEPDHDGSNDRGFLITSKCESFYGVVRISPAWIEFHK